MITPHTKEAMAAGATPTMGKETASESSALLMNQQAQAIPHMTPDTMPGRMTSGYTWREQQSSMVLQKRKKHSETRENPETRAHR